jgi:hypothetical protein
LKSLLENGEGNVSAIGWQGRLNESSTTDDVAAVCDEYLSLLTSQQRAEIPESCLPPAHIGVPEISPYALKLIRQLGVGNRASAPVLHELTTFFTQAALRLAQITTQIAEVTAEQRRSRSAE